MRMTGKASYSRRISAEEAREGYVLVLKNKLSFFPSLGTGFELVKPDLRRKVRVEFYRCTCRGRDLPHEHYFIRWRGLRAKDRVEIRKDARKQAKYLIRIRRPT